MEKPTENQDIIGKDGITYKATTILRKRKVSDQQLEKRTKMRLEALRKRRGKLRNPDLKDKVIRPEKFIMGYREKQKNFVYEKKRGRKEFNPAAKGKAIVALRLRGDKNMTNRQKILMKSLKLKKMHEIAFIKVSDETEKALKACESFITYGFASRNILSEIIKKRAFCKVANEYQPLNSNALIEEHLGHLGLICIADLVTVLTAGSGNFKDVLTFLGAFKLNKPTNGYGSKVKPYRDGGAWGFRGDKINELLERMI